MNAAQMAPSAGNMQGRDYIVVTDQEIKYQLVKAAYDQKFIGQAHCIYQGLVKSGYLGIEK